MSSTMLPGCDEQPGDCPAQMPFPGDDPLLWKHSIDDSAIKKQNQDCPKCRGPASIPPGSCHHVHDQAVDNRAGSDVHGMQIGIPGPANQPGPKAAHKPDRNECDVRSILAVRKEDHQQEKKR